jgi:glycosyltransferase involved in cell wall biosynthesis
MTSHCASHWDEGFPGGFTVLMAVYHADSPQLLTSALKSVYDNSLLPEKILLVVDGPVSVALTQVIENFSRSSQLTPKLVALQLPRNIGLAAALNEGLRHVETEWVLRADADDLNLPERFARQAALLQSSPDLDFFGACILEVSEQKAPIAIRQVPATHEAIVATARWRNPFNHMTVAFRTKCVRDAGGYPQIYLREDYALWATLLTAGAKAANLEEVLVHASAGQAMYKRRGGWKYAVGELALQRHLVTLGRKPAFFGLLQGLVRALVFLLPAFVRGAIYIVLLRRRSDFKPPSG